MPIYKVKLKLNYFFSGYYNPQAQFPSANSAFYQPQPQYNGGNSVTVRPMFPGGGYGQVNNLTVVSIHL